ncbi:MAG: hypothetical protein D4R74_11130 [Betaproteobacteria bacterium]|nr:MAG: hypothetical protein D4R74_11130 [Betaproteobacteria bacterium]
MARHQIDSVNPTLIIAVDDDAQLVAMEFNNKPGISIVFAGINGAIEPNGYDKAANVTGILERKPLLDVREALVAMRGSSGRPLGQRLFHLGDNSESVLMDTAELSRFHWAPLSLVDSKNVPTFE